MPWKDCSPMTLRQEFVVLASSVGENMTGLCERFGISRKTGYKWLARYRQKGIEGLENGSRQPKSSPTKTADAMEHAVLELRHQHPAWGGRKLHHRLKMLGHKKVPASSTITNILHRHQLIDPAESLKHKACQRFEHEEPNDLWQMDFKGHFAMVNSDRCHPLTILDDHSRFSLGLRACANERGATVQQEMIELFRRYGLPRRMLMDNGSPWGSDVFHPYTPLTAWLMRLGIRVSHGRPYHPQTQGKEERFHRTLKAELLRGREFKDLQDCQSRFDPWRDIYNLERPHQALDMKTPASRYRCSESLYPESLPAIEYGPDDKVRQVASQGEISLEGKRYVISKAFRGYPIGLRPTVDDGYFDVYFCSHKIGCLDARGELGRSDAFALPHFARCARSVRQGESEKP
jgi:transposase InsO family protein